MNQKQISNSSSAITDYFGLFAKVEEGASPVFRVALRTAVASSRGTPPEVLAKLASDPVQQVRLAVATNPATPGLVLEQLAIDSQLCAGCSYYLLLSSYKLLFGKEAFAPPMAFSN